MKVYILSPYNKTGGPRSLHQLGNQLVERGLEVYMYYGSQGKKYETKKLLYSDGRMKIATSILDEKDNVLIVPESETGWLLKYSNVQKVIWWLSLDYYLESNLWISAKNRTKNLGEPSFFKYLRYGKGTLKNIIYKRKIDYLKPSQLKNVIHLYNCEYVKHFLLKNSVEEEKMQYLCGPIDYVQNSKENILNNKKNIITYNPKKINKKKFKKVKEYINAVAPNYKFVPLRNMSHEEVIRNLQQSKVYLDLGYFPGPERLPREAVLQYCNIVTSNSGSAKNSVDVPILKKYKFNLDKLDVSKIGNTIIELCENYLNYIDEFDNYRKVTLRQIERFNNDIDKFSERIK